MSKPYGVEKDTSLPLGQIRDRTSSSIISSVLSIVNDHIVNKENWIKSIECLYVAKDNEEPSGKRRRVEYGRVASDSSALLRRRYLDLVSEIEGGRYVDDIPYVAVSYTWQASKEEEAEAEAGRGTARCFLVESRNAGEPALPSKVRPMIWERVLRYAEYVGCRNIWIDNECIDQGNEAEKEAAIQSMHLVYSLSEWPIALLTRRINTAEELELIINLMCDEVAPEDEPAMLDLLSDITSDLWWTRAWTFQEDYRASTRMMLLIPHSRNLEGCKRATVPGLRGIMVAEVEGEIGIQSAAFRERATKFCLSYREVSDNPDLCNKIIKRATKYNVLLKDKSSTYSASRSMSPIILSDILSRGIKNESDRLAIMANCCEYGTRIDTNSLNSDGSSLSLSILAQYLLNGEIIENDPERPTRGTLNHNIHEYIYEQSLSSFRPPVQQGLTFIKGCRFSSARLTPEGTLTRGHLWKLGKVIRRRPMKTYGASYSDLATRLIATVYDPPRTTCRGGMWLSWMINAVSEALEQGKALRLGSLVRSPAEATSYSPYRAVFIGDSRDDWEDEDEVTYAFTSYQFHKEDMPGYNEKHVSLEVDIEWQRSDIPEPPEGGSSYAPPKLYIKRWLNGLCFFEGLGTDQVLFPWHPTLLE
ncbi:heterokaryon incompatibility protein-domain-containing protein [Daldinia caldariorum]|uniref:heterokaryon incompatibility protein-domain-containing protein n=1 Tax=Daldinia caldariorum TaxID=326644 RepID=UPI0020083759|nr:heterokaryon incompatibility protein-domain-containing protein [Daldinia caldariorum]KAI1468923.1 heterokaryon incompatibility protein-domain-containing protein [Daldinia caldariorum]